MLAVLDLPVGLGGRHVNLPERIGGANLEGVLAPLVDLDLVRRRAGLKAGAVEVALEARVGGRRGELERGLLAVRLRLRAVGDLGVRWPGDGVARLLDRRRSVVARVGARDGEVRRAVAVSSKMSSSVGQPGRSCAGSCRRPANRRRRTAPASRPARGCSRAARSSPRQRNRRRPSRRSSQHAEPAGAGTSSAGAVKSGRCAWPPSLIRTVRWLWPLATLAGNW